MLKNKFDLSEQAESASPNIILTIFAYLLSINAFDTNRIAIIGVIGAIEYYYEETGKWLFGTPSCDRGPP